MSGPYKILPDKGRANSFTFPGLVFSFYILFLLIAQKPSDGLSYLRFSPKSFRFPNDHSGESAGDELKPLMGNKNIPENVSQDYVPYGEPRSRASIPSSPSSTSLSSLSTSSLSNSEIKNEKVDSYEDASSAEVIESDDSKLNGSSGYAPTSSQENNSTLLDEEVLRKLLCACSSDTLRNNNFSHASNDPRIFATDTESARSWILSELESQADLSSQLRYDLKAGKCALVGHREHCGENMIFVADIESGAYGYCECDFERKIQMKVEETGAGVVPPPESLKPRMNTPLVYHAGTNACYGLFDQAYCKEGEWLVLSREIKGPVCQPRKCPPSTFMEPSMSASSSDNKPNKNNSRRRTSKLLTPTLWTDDDNSMTELSHSPLTKFNSRLPESPNTGNNLWIPLNGDGPCVRLNEENPEYCDKGEKVLFHVGDVVPKCRIPDRVIEARRAIVRNACPPGSFYSIIGRCQPDWDF